MKLNLKLMDVSILILLVLVVPSSATQNYADALYKSMLFFEGQRSGYLPKDQRVTWRGDSGLSDGWTHNVDLTGGYYDAGDNLKFNFPMAFTTTVLSWSVIEFGDRMPPAEYRNSLVAVRWGTDYLLKSVSQLPDRIFFQVGYPISDHNCWERPEEMDTDRTAYAAEAPQPASEVAGETAAALAASSIAFRSSDPGYADTLLRNAVNAFKYADTYRGNFSDNPNIRAVACPFYCDFNGYQDELLWGAAWLWRATQDQEYLNYILQNGLAFGAQTSIYEFGWDDKHAGLNVLLAKDVLEGKIPDLASYKTSADTFICTLIPESAGPHVGYTPGGLINKPGNSNLQHATTLSLLLVVYADYLSRTGQSINCGGGTVWPDSLHRQAKRQADYILGENPKGMSYMVGYGNYYPQRIHHRGSSLPSMKDHPQKIACKEGTPYFRSLNPNPNVLVGAVVGGPMDNDAYEDDRFDFKKSEPCTYINAPFVGVLAYLNANPNFS